MRTIGFDDASTGLMVIIMSIAILALETPSGILADRWSRKHVAITGAIALGICAMILGISNSIPIFILGAVFWGVYSALYSGTYESMVYDTILEEKLPANHFQRTLGTMRAIEGIAFFIGAILGGLIASEVGLRETYFYSLPPLILAVLSLARFKEPLLHKSEVAEPVYRHISQTFSTVLKRRFLMPAIIASVIFAAVVTTVFELLQLWYIQLDTQLVWFGLIAALLYSTWGFGGLLAKRLSIGVLTKLGSIVVVSAFITMAVSRSSPVTFIAQFIVCVILVALGVLLLQFIHDNLTSKLRAGSASVVSTLTRFIIIPLTFVFTAISDRVDVFAASYVLAGAALVGVLAFFLVKPKTPNTT